MVRTHENLTWRQALKLAAAVWVQVAGTSLVVGVRKNEARGLMATMNFAYENGWWKMYGDHLYINAWGVKKKAYDPGAGVVFDLRPEGGEA